MLPTGRKEVPRLAGSARKSDAMQIFQLCACWLVCRYGQNQVAQSKAFRETLSEIDVQALIAFSPPGTVVERDEFDVISKVFRAGEHHSRVSAGGQRHVESARAVLDSGKGSP